MTVLLDTNVISTTLRRVQVPRVTSEVARIEADGLIAVIGPIRQEVLAGIGDLQQFERVQQLLDSYREIDIERHDYDHAARMFTACRRSGVQAGYVDMLICAVAIRAKASIYTFDADFSHYARVLPIDLHRPTR